MAVWALSWRAVGSVLVAAAGALVLTGPQAAAAPGAGPAAGGAQPTAWGPKVTKYCGHREYSTQYLGPFLNVLKNYRGDFNRNGRHYHRVLLTFTQYAGDYPPTRWTEWRTWDCGSTQM